VRWDSFSVYGVKLHLLCATNGVPISYELTPANVAEVRLTEELLAEANLGDDLARRFFGDLAYRSDALGHALAECGISLVTQRADQHGQRQRIEIALSSLKRAFGLDGTLATTLVGLASRIAAKICAYTYAFQVNRLLGRAQMKAALSRLADLVHFKARPSLIREAERLQAQYRGHQPARETRDGCARQDLCWSHGFRDRVLLAPAIGLGRRTLLPVRGADPWVAS
jgi:Transposase DDE domain